MTVLAAAWSAPPGVKAFTTLRSGGVSTPPYDSLNLATHVGDDPDRVAANRRLVVASQGWTTEPLWLAQVHGTDVVRAEGPTAAPPRADGAVTSQRGQPLVVLTADCLPVVACDKAGTVVGAFHAGWKGLLAGILERGIEALDRPSADLVFWIGPAIGPESYQVGDEVRSAFLASNPAHEAEFTADGPGRWKFQLAGAAVRRLTEAGVASVAVGPWDTLRDEDLFFSHRRTTLEHLASGRPGTPVCGRVATMIVLEERKYE